MDTKQKKPFIINAEIRKEYSKPTFYKSVPASDKPKKGILQRILSALTTQTSTNYSNQNATYDQIAQNINEDSKGDFLALDDEELIFSEEE